MNRAPDADGFWNFNMNALSHSAASLERRNIVCMKWGTFYGADDVNRLYRMLKSNITGPFRLVCFTDNDKDILPEVECHPLPPFASAHLQTMGAYRKKTLCRADLQSFKTGERFLFLDLDVVIMGNLDALFAFEPEKDFIICRNWTRGNGQIGNSSGGAVAVRC